MQGARAALARELARRPDLLEAIDLRGRRARGHAATSTAPRWPWSTPAADVPADAVLLNAEHHPDTMVIVVGGVELDRAAVPPRASGGVLRVVHPWSVDHADLTPIAYRYRLR